MGVRTATRRTAPWGLTYQTQVLSLSTQGTTVRIITAIDQDKGRPRGIGYTIVSGKAWGTLVPHPYSRRTTLGVSGSVGVWDSGMRGPVPRDSPGQRTQEGTA